MGGQDAHKVLGEHTIQFSENTQRLIGLPVPQVRHQGTHVGVVVEDLEIVLGLAGRAAGPSLWSTIWRWARH